MRIADYIEGGDEDDDNENVAIFQTVGVFPEISQNELFTKLSNISLISTSAKIVNLKGRRDYVTNRRKTN